jgi:hypothetical protein
MKSATIFRNFFFAVATLSVAAFPIAAQPADDAPETSYDAPYAGPSGGDSQPVDPNAYPAPRSSAPSAGRVGYAHVTAAEGTGLVLSEAKGRTNMQINLPLAEGDQLETRSGGRAEIELADGNRVQIAGESGVRLDALAGEQGSAAEESALTLLEGSIAVETGTFAGNRAFRVDTPDASVYVTSGAQARINLDPHRGTTVIARRGTFDVQTQSGSVSVQEGQYVMVRGDDQPELARGTFSRDRFDVWVAQRSAAMLQAHNSNSARYLNDEAYDEDVAVLDHYGSWDYSPTYETNVWRPDVSSDWSPYSDGYWDYTPAGATWVDNAPWGWFPHHYGNWFFDAGFSSWCWSPASIYSPGWVYWGFSGGYTGWCPIGYYSYYAPWGSYWGWGWGSGLYFSVNGVFDRGHIDCGRGWNFVGTDSFGTHFGQRSVLSGTQAASRLGSDIAVTSNPLRAPLVSGRGSASSAMRSLALSAPATIARSSTSAQSAALAPYLARQRTLPPQTVNTLRQSQVARVNPVSRSLQGPGTTSLPAVAPRTGAQTRSLASRPLGGGSFANPGGSGRSEGWRAPGRSVSPGSVPASPRAIAIPPADTRGNEWRSRQVAPRGERTLPSFRQRSTDGSRPASPGTSPGSLPRSGRFAETPAESWRARPVVPPAQRVIEGIDRGRALPPSRASESWRSMPDRRSFEPTPPARVTPESRQFQRQAPPARVAPESRQFERQAPPPRVAPESRQFERQAPPPRYESRAAPPSFDRRSAPPPRYERQAPASPRFERQAPPPPPRAESRSAPPAREFRAPSPAPRSAPAPRQEFSRRNDRSPH